HRQCRLRDRTRAAPFPLGSTTCDATSGSARPLMAVVHAVGETHAADQESPCTQCARDRSRKPLGRRSRTAGVPGVMTDSRLSRRVPIIDSRRTPRFAATSPQERTMKNLLALLAALAVLLPQPGSAQEERPYDYWKFNRDV